MKGILGPTQLVILNRILRVEEGVMTYAPDTKHVKLLCEGMELAEESKELETPVAKEEQRNEDENDDLTGAPGCVPFLGVGGEGLTTWPSTE